MNNKKIEALAQHLGIDPELEIIVQTSDDMFLVGDMEYLVLELDGEVGDYTYAIVPMVEVV